MNSADPQPLSGSFAELLHLLLMTEPVADLYDVRWHGPYYIPRPRLWCPSYFLLYGGKVYGTLYVGLFGSQGSWDTESGEFAVDRGMGSFSNVYDPEALWEQAVPQLARRLRSALRNPAAYNRRVARLIPLEARTGRVRRRMTWPRGTRAPLSPTLRVRAEEAFRTGAESRSLGSLTAAAYFDIASLAYDAAFPDLAELQPEQKYKKRADSRHGGLLDLDRNDPVAFRNWYTSRSWAGTHPWEIVFGHPHGILLQPLLDSEGGWRFHLSVDALGLYLAAARMAVALGEAGVPFEFGHKDEVVAALRGVDWVEIGPLFGQLSFEELRETRPEAVDHVVWDPLSEIRPISDAQRERALKVLRTGSPHS